MLNPAINCVKGVQVGLRQSLRKLEYKKISRVRHLPSILWRFYGWFTNSWHMMHSDNWTKNYGWNCAHISIFVWFKIIYHHLLYNINKKLVSKGTSIIKPYCVKHRIGHNAFCCINTILYVIFQNLSCLGASCLQVREKKKLELMYYALFIVWHKSNKPLVLLEMPNPLLKRK